jgi:LysM domain/Bacterial SH3 domain
MSKSRLAPISEASSKIMILVYNQKQRRLWIPIMPHVRRVVYFILVFLCAAPLFAQSNDCPSMVDAALKAVGDVCAATGSNQACYGNLTLQAEPQPGVTDLTFNQPGDVVRVASLRSLQLNPFDLTNHQWGVALMRLQANIPDTLPGQNVTFLLFGDVQLENKVAATPSPTITLSANTILLGAPQADAPLVGALSAGETAYTLSRSADGGWVRVERTSSDSRTGWIPAALVPEAGSLPIYDPTAPAPMEAFSLRTGLAGVGCAAVPPDGILVQTPGDNIKVKFTVNDVDIQLGSTAFLQAQPNSNLSVSVIEGEGQVEALGQTVDVPAGSSVRIPMDAALEPTGAISPPAGYDAGTLGSLPVSLLQRPITIAPPIETTARQKLCVNNANGAWLRAQPSSANQTILRTLANRETVVVTGATSNDGVQDWQPVETADGQATGWVEASSLAGCGAAPLLVNCTPRADWTIIYTVQPGNGLAQIAQGAGVSLNDLAQANCLADVNKIAAGQQLHVPRMPIIPTATPQTTEWPISTGNWGLTSTILYEQGCQVTPPTSERIPYQMSGVHVWPDGQSLTYYDTGALNMQRTGPNTFSGITDYGDPITLTITGDNQGIFTHVMPCPSTFQISSGQWNLTFSFQYDPNCPAATSEAIPSGSYVVEVNPDGQFLAITSGGSGILLQNTGSNTFSGPYVTGGTMTLTVTGTNQGDVTVFQPCVSQ